MIGIYFNFLQNQNNVQSNLERNIYTYLNTFLIWHLVKKYICDEYE